MKPTKRYKSLTVPALVILLTGLCFSLQLFHTTGGKASANRVYNLTETPAPEDRPCPVCAGPASQVIYAPTIALPESSGTELVLNSRSPNVMDVTPTLYTIDGTPVTGEALRLQPSEIRFINIENLIPREYRGARRWGGMSLSYTGGTREVWAQLALHGVGGGGSVDVLFTVLKETGSDVQEGLWWMPDKGTATLALGNTSDSAVSVNLRYGDGESEDVEIAPHATAYVKRHANNRGGRSARDGYGESVKITTTGPVGSVRVAGFVTSAEKGFTSSIRFYDPRTITQPNLFATSFHVKSAATRMLLRNISASEITATPRFLPASGEAGAPVELQALSLKPQETVEVDLTQLKDAAIARNDLNVVSVSVENSGAPGSLIGALYSTDVKTRTIYDAPLRDSGPMRNLTGAYPWRLDGDFSTIVSVTNIGKQPTKFAVNIFYEGGKYVLNPQELAAGETATFDLRKIRDEQMPDNAGNVIPRSVSSGQFNWSIHGAAEEGTKLIGRGEVVSRSRKVNISYSCPTCCPNSFYQGSFSPNVISVGVNQFAAVIPRETYRDCYLRILGPYDAWPQWWVSDTSRISISQTQYGSATITGLAEGSTSFTAGFSGPTYTDVGSGYCYRYTGYNQQSGTGTVNATVAVSAIAFSPTSIRAANVPTGNTPESSTLTVQVSSTPGVCPGSTATVEIFQISNSMGINIVTSPVELTQPVTISSPGNISPVSWSVTADRFNTKTGGVQYAARIQPGSLQKPPNSSCTTTQTENTAQKEGNVLTIANW